MSKILLLAVFALLAGVFFAVDQGRFLSLEYLKASQSDLAELYAQSPWCVRGAYLGAYIALAGLSLPGAAVLTLAAGAVFGMGWGLLPVSFASSAGATLAFLTARYALRDSVQTRFGARLRDINLGVERDGVFT